SAEALADDLQRFLDDRPIQARRTPIWEHAWRWSRRNPGVSLLALAVAALLVVVVSVESGSLLLGAAALLAALGFAASLSAVQFRRLAAQERRSRAEAEQARRQAEERARAEAEAREKLETNLYYRWIALAQQARAAGDAARAEELLDECPARRRGWE